MYVEQETFWMFCPSRRFVPPDITSHGCFFSSCYVTGRFVWAPIVLRAKELLRETSTKKNVFAIISSQYDTALDSYIYKNTEMLLPEEKTLKKGTKN
jgi:hypothetical protein